MLEENGEKVRFCGMELFDSSILYSFQVILITFYLVLTLIKFVITYFILSFYNLLKQEEISNEPVLYLNKFW